ncbi:hypothetical protein FA13DRAFT_1729626 [Coprinellus micaceus]|uniref:Uncharacterized protein n=1 Tax=Coprinellus micaceus TaxID=71717 RepID=A0A4Y7TIY8_COPMI|nr:hypothetical protein FA13DRAFT_1729626 [Coprinellus micaceus]
MAQGYASNACSYGLGIPCSNSHVANRLSCGDVGTFTQDSGFRKLWNLWDMDDTSKAALKKLFTPSPDGEIFWPERTLEADSGVRMWEPGDALTFNANAEYTQSDSEEFHSTFDTTITAEEGSVIPIISPVYRFNVTRKTQLALKRFIVRNAKGLYQWTQERHEDHIVSGTPLYFITGYYETSACAMAGFRVNDARDEVSLHVRSSDGQKRDRLGSVQLKFSWGERFGNSENKTTVYCGDGTMDQYLFLQGFTLLPRDGTSNQDNVAASTETNGPMNEEHGSPSPLAWTKHQLSWITDLAECMKENHPSNLSNRILFAQTPAAFSLTHDDDWRFILKGQCWNLAGVSRFVLSVGERQPVVVQNNVAHFEDGWIDDLRCPSHSGGVRRVRKRAATASSPRVTETQIYASPERPMKKRPVRLGGPRVYPLPSTNNEVKLAFRIFQTIHGSATMTLPLHVAKEHIQCTGFAKEEFFVYLNLSRGSVWGVKDGELSIDMLIFGLRTAAFTRNADHGVWSTLDIPGSMPKVEVLSSDPPKRPIVRLTFIS